MATAQEIAMMIGDLDLRLVRHSDRPQSKGVVQRIKQKPGTSTVVLHVFFNGVMDIIELKDRLLDSFHLNEEGTAMEVRMFRKASSPKGYSLVFYNE